MCSFTFNGEEKEFERKGQQNCRINVWRLGTSKKTFKGMLKLNIYAKLFNLIYYEVFSQLQKELVRKNQPFSFYSSFKVDFYHICSLCTNGFYNHRIIKCHHKAPVIYLKNRKWNYYDLPSGGVYILF